MKNIIELLPYYFESGIITKYCYHIIIFNKWHFTFHYRNDFNLK